MTILSSFLDTKIRPTGFIDLIELLKAGNRIGRVDWDNRQYLVKRHTALFIGLPHIVGDDHYPQFDDHIQVTLNGTLAISELGAIDWVPWYYEDQRDIDYPDALALKNVLGTDEVLDNINRHFKIYKNMLIFKTEEDEQRSGTRTEKPASK